MSLIKSLKASFLLSLTQDQISNIDKDNVKKVLFLKYEKIGDMIVATPVFRELKKALPHVKIFVLASSVNRGLLNNNPYVDKVYTYKNNWMELFPILLQLRKYSFDVCFEFEAKVVTRAILMLKIIKPKFVASISKVHGRYGISADKLKIYDFYTRKNNKDHWRDICLDILSFLKIKSKSNKYDIFLSDKEKNKAKKFVSNINSKIKIGINLEGSFKEKQIQPEELKKICKGIYDGYSDIQIVILTTPHKLEKTNKIISKMGFDFVIPSYVTGTILDVAALIEQLDLIITPDTSIVHIASAFDKPIVSIYENDKNSYRLWHPTSTLSSVVFAKDRYDSQLNYNVTDIIKYSLAIIEKHK
ncbi:MAG TPA: lipopolysaccharide heptosyltransferase family protein [Candidatus Poseidoniales archaeon]|nr:lipopolysaccharide heptosyltransferase family protein [Candidatus Poseidoniales archaeon]